MQRPCGSSLTPASSRTMSSLVRGGHLSFGSVGAHTSVPAEFFYRTHDPTTVNRQGADTGTREYSVLVAIPRCPYEPSSVEYRSAIFYHTPEQLEIAKRVTEEVQKKHFDPIGMLLPYLSRGSVLMFGSQARRS